MRSTWMTLVILALSAVDSLVGAAEQAQKSKSAWIGMVTMCDADTTIIRDGRHFQVSPGAGILDRDIIASGLAGPVSLKLFDGPGVTLQAGSNAAITHHSTGHSLKLFKGEMRLVHGGQTPLTANTDELSLRVQRAIVRLRRTDAVTHSELTLGVADLVQSNQVWAMQAGQPVVGRKSGVAQASAVAWTIDEQQVRLASAVQAAPQLQLPAAPGTTIAPPTTGATAAGPVGSSANPNAAQSLAAQEAERRRRRQRGTTDVTRGGSTQGPSNRGTATPGFGGNSSLSLGAFSGATGAFSSGGLSSDANQQTFQGSLSTPAGTVAFPGQIHLVTAETKNVFSNVQLNSAEQAALAGNSYYSIGTGSRPTGQVITDANTASNPQPNAQNIAQFDAHIVKLDQYGPVDAALDPAGALTSNAGITGLVGNPPSGPTVIGTAPLIDERARINGTATFALGEFRVSVSPQGQFSVAARSSDQDRTIVKDINGNDANDVVTVNPDVDFTDVVDSRFLPQSPTVKVPTVLNNRTTNYSGLGFTRQAAFTTIVAESLKSYSLRTGQTRFVVDGRIVDISGYQP